MKYLFLMTLSLLAVSSSYSQSKKFTFKLGSEYSLPKKSWDLSFFGNDKDGIVNLTIKKDELNVLKFDPKTLIQTGESKIAMPEKTKNFKSEKLVDLGTNYFWLHSNWDKSQEKEYLYYDKIDVVNGMITATEKKIIETTQINSFEVWLSLNSLRKDKYRFNFDAENKKLLISYRLIPEKIRDKENFDKIGLHVFDENMNKIWGNEFTMPYTEAIMDNADFSVDAKGNAYMLAKIYDSEKRKEKDKETGKAAYHYEVLKFTKDNKQIVHTTILIDDYFIRDATLIENSLHEMVITCTYSKKSKGTGTDGIFLAMMDQTGKINKYKNGYYEFPLAELEKFESARSKIKMENKTDYEAPNLSVRNIVVESDGSILIACEERFAVSINNYSERNYITTKYYYENILALKITAAGNFAWVRKIPKKQMGDGGIGTLSFKLISDSTGYYFLFLDNKKNMELTKDEVPKYHVDGFGGQVVVAKIDNAGTVTKELVFDTREEDVMLFPTQFRRINGNQFIGRASIKRGDYKPLLITVN
jgi:hypothetical protein